MKHKTYKKIYMCCQDIGIGKIINKIPDELYLKIVYFLQSGTWIDIKHPSTYNEKLPMVKNSWRI